MNFVRCCCWLLCSVQLLFVEINFYHNLLALGGEGERNFAVYLSRLNSISQVSVKKRVPFPLLISKTDFHLIVPPNDNRKRARG